MRISYAIALILLAAAALTGLGVLFLHVEGLARLQHDVVLVLAVAVVILLLLLGFFASAVYHRNDMTTRKAHRTAVKRLKTALDTERKHRLEVSREKYQLRQYIVSLEGKLKGYAAAPMEAVSIPQMVKNQLSEEDDDIVNLMDEEMTVPGEALAPIGELEELAARCETLRGELHSRKERMADLQAELSVARSEAEAAKEEIEHLRSTRTSAVPTPAKRTLEFKGKTLNEILDGIVSMEGVSVALVADDQGLVVDAAGDYLQPDALAAVSGVVAELSPRVTDLLPIGEIVKVALGDRERKVMEMTYFPLLGARCALAIIRDESVFPDTSKAIEAIVAKLG